MKVIYANDDPLSKSMTVRLSPAELLRIDEVSNFLKVDRSKLVRWMLLQSLKRLTAIASSKAALNGK